MVEQIKLPGEKKESVTCLDCGETYSYTREALIKGVCRKHKDQLRGKEYEDALERLEGRKIIRELVI